MTDTERNQQVFDQEYVSYRTTELLPPERTLLDRFASRWSEMHVLDIGVGCGRTAHTFAPLAKTYLGVDYAEAMIAECRRTIGQSDRVAFEVMDARTLAGLPAGHYDVVLFSFNGIDYVDETDRDLILRAVHRVCRASGCFFFSSHSLASLPQCSGRWAITGAHRERAGLAGRARALAAGLVLRLMNRGIDWRSAMERGWAVVRDSAHGFKLRTFYAHPRYQVAQLAAAGFECTTIYDARGQPIADAGQPPLDAWLSYHCVPRAR